MVTVRVSDTGAGIPEEMRERCSSGSSVWIKPFEGNRRTGLGLAIVKHAVQYHHGTICVEGAQGEGTTFVLRLPAA